MIPMQKLFLQKDIRTIDNLTIEAQGITSLALMERAATTVSEWLMHNMCKEIGQKVAIVVGPGNNGGDGLVVARQLAMIGCNVVVYSFTGRSGRRSNDCDANLKRLPDGVELYENRMDWDLSGSAFVVDALLGTGLSKEPDGLLKEAICMMNTSGLPIVSIDMPSGMGDEEMMKCVNKESIVKADYTISFQFPKLSFLMPESEEYLGELVVTDIGLDKTAIDSFKSDYWLTDKLGVAQMIKKRSRYAHKGIAGRSMIIAGSKGMMGAAQLAARGCMRSGVGLLTMVVPQVGYEIMQIGVPEAMAKVSGLDVLEWSEELVDGRLDSAGIGPGLGRGEHQCHLVDKFFNAYNSTPMVVDADALWHVANGLELPQGAIITPHEAEFDRLTKKHYSRIERIESAKRYANDKQVIVVLKGAYTAICMPSGRVVFNSTGNAGMATGGCGDVLTGVLTALLAQGYSPEDAAVIGVYIHGLAGDMACEQLSEIGLVAGDLADMIGRAWRLGK